MEPLLVGAEDLAHDLDAFADQELALIAVMRLDDKSAVPGFVHRGVAPLPVRPGERRLT
jgi:hypothetical protein